MSTESTPTLDASTSPATNDASAAHAQDLANALAVDENVEGVEVANAQLQLAARGAGPFMHIPMVLSCWGTAASALKTRQNPGVTSYLTARLPEYALRGNLSISVWARTNQPGRRVFLSIESPFAHNSVLEVGTRSNGTEVYAATLPTGAGKWIWSGVHMGADWTHVVVVWAASTRTFYLNIGGKVKAVKWADSEANDRFLTTTKEWRLVLGRGKETAVMRDGWNGEITEIAVWNRALSLNDVQELGRQYPEPMNPTLPKIPTDFRV